MPSWPSDLPQKPLVQGFSETAPTLAGGALSYSWTHPISGAAITCRIVEPPGFTPAAGGVSWVATVTVEILP